MTRNAEAAASPQIAQANARVCMRLPFADMLTATINACRIGDHLLERLSSRRSDQEAAYVA